MCREIKASPVEIEEIWYRSLLAYLPTEETCITQFHIFRWWREHTDSFDGRFAVLFPINKDHVTFVANAPLAHLEKHGLPFQKDRSRSG